MAAIRADGCHQGVAHGPLGGPLADPDVVGNDGRLGPMPDHESFASPRHDPAGAFLRRLRQVGPDLQREGLVARGEQSGALAQAVDGQIRPLRPALVRPPEPPRHAKPGEDDRHRQRDHQRQEAHHGPPAIPVRPPVGRGQRIARAADGQPDQRRRRRRRRFRFIQLPRQLEDVGHLLARPRPVAVERHRQGEVIQPRGTEPRKGPDQERHDDPCQADAQQNLTSRPPEPKPRVERDKDGPDDHDCRRGVECELQRHLEPEPPPRPREPIAQ
jgi:hypothetical protein